MIAFLFKITENSTNLPATTLILNPVLLYGIVRVIVPNTVQIQYAEVLCSVERIAVAATDLSPTQSDDVWRHSVHNITPEPLIKFISSLSDSCPRYLAARPSKTLPASSSSLPAMIKWTIYHGCFHSSSNADIVGYYVVCMAGNYV